MLIEHFRFEFWTPIVGQCVFRKLSGDATPIIFQDETVGYANVFASTGKQDLKTAPYFRLVHRGIHNHGSYTIVRDFKIHNFIGLYDRGNNPIFSNDILYDHSTEMQGRIENLNGGFFFLPNNTKDLSVNGRKKLTNKENWSIVGNSVDGSLI